MEHNYAAQNKRASFATSPRGLAVYPLWKGGVKDALQQFGSYRTNLTRKLAVAAVLPNQVLNLNEMDELEAAGLLVVEVPQTARDYRDEQLATFLDEQIDGPESLPVGSADGRTPLAEAQAASELNIAVAGAAGVAGAIGVAAAPDVPAHELSQEEEGALLDLINDPEADEGGF